MMVWMAYPHLFPALLVVLDLAAAVRYGCGGDWGRVVYWGFAAGITACATWGMGE